MIAHHILFIEFTAGHVRVQSYQDIIICIAIFVPCSIDDELQQDTAYRCSTAIAAIKASVIIAHVITIARHALSWKIEMA